MKQFTFLIFVIALLYNVNTNSQWSAYSSPFYPGNMNAIAVVDTSTIYVATTFYVLKSNNGGQSYGSSLYQPLEFDDVEFINSNTGFAVARAPSYSIIYRTTSAGALWEQSTPIPLLSIYKLSFLNVNTGFASTFGGIYKTTDSGLNWTNTFTELVNFTGIFFIDVNTGWGISDLGLIERTTNGGTSWMSAGINPGTSMNGLFFLNSSTGWIASDNGKIHKTTNAGWIPFTTSQAGSGSCRLNAVYFFNDMTGWTAGCQGSVYRSNDGGESWTLQTNGLTSTIFDIKFANSQTGWASGTNGKVLRTTNGGITAVTPISSNVPEGFELSQNYPNPFNPSTGIVFTVPKTSNVKITVYNSTGKEITVLANEQLRPGTYRTDWIGTDYSSGIYFYRMTVSGESKGTQFSETRKMILLK